MIVEHLHRLLEIVELLGVDAPDLVVADAFAHNQLVQLLGRWVFSHVEELGCKIEPCEIFLPI